jgi:ERCC4 domain-containing protein
MPEDFLIARNPDPASAPPYLIRVPLPDRPVVLKARETWPRTSKVYCHRADTWPDVPDIVERVPTRACERRGAAIDLVLDRARENRSQLVFTRVRGGREAIFWQSARTTRQARPLVRTPTARAAGVERLTIVVDSHERYAYRFAQQQVDLVRRALPAGDHAVEGDGQVVAAVERKSLADLVSSLVSGRLRYALGELAALPRAAVVVEDRWSQVFKLTHVRPAVVADGIAATHRGRCLTGRG